MKRFVLTLVIALQVVIACADNHNSLPVYVPPYIHQATVTNRNIDTSLPVYQFQSTSSLTLSGSQYSSSLSDIGAARPRRKTETNTGNDSDDNGNPFGDNNVDDTPNAEEPGGDAPVGDIPWLLMLLAVAVKIFEKKSKIFVSIKKKC